MEAIKRYTEAQKLDPSLAFGISRMADIYAQHNGKPDSPHRHDYYTALLVRQATGSHLLDFNVYPLKARHVYFIAPGQIHQLREKTPSEGFAIVFSDDFLIRNHIPPDFIEDLNLFSDASDRPPLALNEEECEQLTAFCEAMLTLFHTPVKYHGQALGAYLTLFLIHCNNLCSLPSDMPGVSQAQSLMKEFRKLLNSRYTSWHSAGDYARALHVSPDHLNRTIKAMLGCTVKEMIQNRIILEAKRLLSHSKLASKEVGYLLGFNEPAHFSSFFKTCTGLSPSAFRKTDVGFL